MKKTLLGVVIHSFFAWVGFAQSPVLIPQSFETISSNPVIWNAVKDDNDIWYMANNQGVLIFNGFQWQIVETPNPVRCLKMSHSKILWVGCNEEFGYIKFKQGETPVYKSLLSDETNLSAYSFSSVLSIEVVGNAIYFLTEATIFSTVLIDNQVDKVRAIRFQHPIEGVGKIGNQSVIYAAASGLMGFKGGLPQKHPKSPLFEMPGLYKTADNNSVTIIAGLDDRLYFYSENKLIPLPEGTQQLTTKGRIFDIAINESGNIAVATFSQGLLLLDKHGNLTYQIKQELEDLYSVVANKNQFWIGAGKGLFLLTNSPATQTTIPPINSQINDLLKIESTIYVATNQGLYRFLNNNLEVIPGTSGIEFWQIIQKEADILAATTSGLLRVSGNKIAPFLTGNPTYYVQTTENGIAIAGRNFAGILKNADTTNVNLISRFRFEANSITQDKNGNMWIGTNYQGVVKIIGNGKVQIFNTTSGLPAGRVAVFVVAGVPYFLAKNGLYLFEKDIFKPIAGFNEVKINEITFWKIIDNKYFGCVFRGKIYLFEQKSNAIFKQVTNHGLNFGANSIRVFYGKSDTFWVLDKTKLIQTSISPTAVQAIIPYVSNIRNKNGILFSGEFADSSVSFSNEANSFVMNFGIKGNQTPGNEQVWTRIHGYQDEWIEINNNGFAVNNLSFGKYAIELKTLTGNGSEAYRKALTIEIQPPWYLRWWSISLFVACLGAGIYGVIKLNARRLQKENQKLDALVNLKTQELQELNKSYLDVANSLKENLEDKMASITYASRIQQAFFPNTRIAKVFFSDFALWWRPRDIVSGDFYWTYQTQDSFYIAAADCTGHGVPGAFMSIMGISFLNTILISNDTLSPCKILDSLDDMIRVALQEQTGHQKVQDGMDIALCKIHKSSLMMEYSGAFRPLIVIQNGEQIPYPASRSSIGGLDKVPFEQVTIQLIQGDTVILYSDGITDQFGGEMNKKFSTKRFREIIEVNKRASNDVLIKSLEENFEEWCKDKPQTDDILVMAFSV